MAPALYLLNKTIKEAKKINLSTYLSLFILILINLYGVHSSILGKLFNVLIVLFIILEQNITFGIIAFCIILLLNNNLQEGLDNITPPSSEPTPADKGIDAIATFKKEHCNKEGKLIDNKTGKLVDLDDLSTVFPNIEFNLKNEKCNPCEDNCGFKLTSGTELLTVEQDLRPIPSNVVG
jgi:hypothetical protein